MAAGETFMNSITNLIVAIILAVGFTYTSPKLHQLLKKEAIKKVNHGLSPLSPFTKKLTLK
jgi:hypothetical protein